MLLEDFANSKKVKLYHMGFNEEDDDFGIEFSYKFVEGSCPQSFGLNVARMAGLPFEVLERARHKSLAFNQSMTSRCAAR